MSRGNRSSGRRFDRRGRGTWNSVFPRYRGLEGGVDRMADETVRPLLEQGAICRRPRVHVATGQIRARGEERQPGEQEHRSQDLKPFGKRNGDGQGGSIQERAACEAVNGESDREDRRRSEL